MSLLSKKQLQQLGDSVKKVEKQTDAELVTVLAGASDEYYYIPTLWAAMFALVTPALLSLSALWFDWFELIISQGCVFIMLALVFRFPFLRYLLVPRSVKKSRASMMAKCIFLEQGLHHTQGETGILIFVSEAEHHVEILVDRGISEKVDNHVWQSIVEEFTTQVKAGNVFKGFEDCIAKVAEVASEVVPATEKKNELSDRLVII